MRVLGGSNQRRRAPVVTLSNDTPPCPVPSPARAGSPAARLLTHRSRSTLLQCAADDLSSASPGSFGGTSGSMGSGKYGELQVYVHDGSVRRHVRIGRTKGRGFAASTEIRVVPGNERVVIGFCRAIRRGLAASHAHWNGHVRATSYPRAPEKPISKLGDTDIGVADITRRSRCASVSASLVCTTPSRALGGSPRTTSRTRLDVDAADAL